MYSRIRLSSKEDPPCCKANSEPRLTREGARPGSCAEEEDRRRIHDRGGQTDFDPVHMWGR